MKKILVASAVLGLASMAQATIISVACPTSSASSVAPLVPDPGSTTSHFCPSLAAPGGSTVNSVTLDIKYDAGFGFGAGNVDMIHDVFDGALSAFDGTLTFNVSDTSRPKFGNIVMNSPGAGVLAALAAGANVGGHYLNTTGSNSSVTFDFVWSIDYTDQQSTIPEPATYAMMAAGLLGFYALRRKA